MKNKAGAALSTACRELHDTVHAIGDYDHVVARVQRGHILIYAGDDEPVARITAIGNAQYGLSFRTHSAHWEPMPVSGDISEIARTMVDTLRPYLAKDPF